MFIIINMTLKEFWTTTSTIDTYYNYVLYELVAIITGGYLGILIYAPEKRNCSILAFLITILVYAVTSALYYYAIEKSFLHVIAISLGIVNTSELLIHWMMCNYYLKLAIEGPYLLNQSNHRDDPEAKQRLKSKLCYLKIADLFNVVIALIVGVLRGYAFYYYDTKTNLYNVMTYVKIGVMAG